MIYPSRQAASFVHIPLRYTAILTPHSQYMTSPITTLLLSVAYPSPLSQSGIFSCDHPCYSPLYLFKTEVSRVRSRVRVQKCTWVFSMQSPPQHNSKKDMCVSLLPLLAISELVWRKLKVLFASMSFNRLTNTSKPQILNQHTTRPTSTYVSICKLTHTDPHLHSLPGNKPHLGRPRLDYSPSSANPVTCAVLPGPVSPTAAVTQLTNVRFSPNPPPKFTFGSPPTPLLDLGPLIHLHIFTALHQLTA